MLSYQSFRSSFSAIPPSTQKQKESYNQADVALQIFLMTRYLFYYPKKQDRQQGVFARGYPPVQQQQPAEYFFDDSIRLRFLPTQPGNRGSLPGHLFFLKIQYCHQAYNGHGHLFYRSFESCYWHFSSQ